ncbi:MAG: hypothetical protein K0S18_213 [Anaerocolumna sp.]|jgi:hypothetical protein|nr:hypothetical protein [Anaerocolumna sp.]
MVVQINNVYGRGASFSSTLQDMADIEECSGKEKLPKSG